MESTFKALEFAAKKHINQRRKDKDSSPYINHPIGVAKNIISIGKVEDVNVIQAALLHDTVEDTNTTEQELKDTFGDKIASIVMEVTDDKSLPKPDRKRAQIAHASHISHEARLVKLGDKLYNLTDILQNGAPNFWDATVVQGYFVWAKAVIDQIRGTNQALESKLDEVFSSNFTYKDGKQYPANPCKTPQEEKDFLEIYYKSLKGK
ncbi:guanosine-3' [Tieghemostelium lacteum]|uniref:Guanosine-3',5'-bis(diphosphate) 3'-pyrophosphohydrolase MESH1 n=1 Tax=Tieghemostelium lacteum TaxID=361077 RepID=A0A152A3V4_TIELA|nr:guanosine-3' [Tieghemostelium lacteum]|eukprot:KYR00884.1 guanosine-3' [Tieghemostelium lacteum]